MALKNETEKTLDQLEKLIQELVRRFELAARDRSDYLAELNKTKIELQNAKNKIAEQEKKLEHYELKQALLSGAGSDKRAKRKLGRLVKEIDKCISLLND